MLVYMLNVRLKEFEDRGCEDVMRELHDIPHTSRSDYRIDMDYDDMEVYAGTSFFGNDKYEDKYCYKDVYYDSQVFDSIDTALKDYKERVQKEIAKKVALLSKPVANSKAALLNSGVGDSKAALLK